MSSARPAYDTLSAIGLRLGLPTTPNYVREQRGRLVSEYGEEVARDIQAVVDDSCELAARRLCEALCPEARFTVNEGHMTTASYVYGEIDGKVDMVRNEPFNSSRAVALTFAAITLNRHLAREARLDANPAP